MVILGEFLLALMGSAMGLQHTGWLILIPEVVICACKPFAEFSLSSRMCSWCVKLQVWTGLSSMFFRPHFIHSQDQSELHFVLCQSKYRFFFSHFLTHLYSFWVVITCSPGVNVVVSRTLHDGSMSVIYWGWYMQSLLSSNEEPFQNTDNLTSENTP